jgi:hypothetical protein
MTHTPTMRPVAPYELFHAMEKFSAIFPRYGKIFSTPWKNSDRNAPSPQKFSTPGKKVFHTVENLFSPAFSCPAEARR